MTPCSNEHPEKVVQPPLRDEKTSLEQYYIRNAVDNMRQATPAGTKHEKPRTPRADEITYTLAWYSQATKQLFDERPELFFAPHDV
jgi:hypothetical protein